MDLRNLRVGMAVKIKRSNGRVHEASVSGIEADKRFVSVEWVENSETKGKEVEFDQLFLLNSHLLGSPDPTPVKKDASNDRKTFFSPVAAAMPKPKSLAELNRPPVVLKARADSSSVSGLPPRPVSGNVQRKPQQSQVTGGVKAVPAAKQLTPMPAVAGNDKPAPRRKSNCVKEVEKMTKNRADRRVKAAEFLQQRIEGIDRSHPHWEFLRMINQQKEEIDNGENSYHPVASTNKICVCVRKRPLNKKEIKKKDFDVSSFLRGVDCVVHEPKLKVDLLKYLENHEFRYDYAFDETVNNQTVYRCTAQPLVHSIFEQGMATCFAYGQTGSGKTHTMGGVFTGKEQDCTAGIYSLAAADVFRLISSAKHCKKDLVVSSSYFEIYSGKVFDLLNSKRRLQILEDAKQQVQVVGLTEHPVTNIEAVWELIKAGNATRTSGATSANQHSSRSHAVFQLILRKRSTEKLHGKFSLIDLAGNERGVDTMTAERHTRLEGAEINKSLLALKECIRALGRKGCHLPFRASKLTQVLRDSFIGDKARTCMIAMISPGYSCCEHTLNTLRYADRVKELPHSGKPKPPPSAVVAEADPVDYPVDYPVETSDLQLLHDECNSSIELLSFHEAINNLVEAEEELVEEHKSCLEETRGFLAEEEELLTSVDGIDYNIEDYVKQLDWFIHKKLERLSKLQEHVKKFQRKLNDEENACKKMKGHDY